MKPTLEEILEFNGPRMDPAAESTPHANTQIYNSTREGAELMPKFMDDDSEVARARRNLAREQTGVGFHCNPPALSVCQPMHGQRTTSQLLRRMPLPSPRENFMGKEHDKATAENPAWDQNGDSSSAASACASAEEVGYR